jgi:hypothetical protein
MSESLSIETLIKDQKLIISKFQKELLKENLNFDLPLSQNMAGILLTHCQTLKALEELSNSSEAIMDGGEF